MWWRREIDAQDKYIAHLRTELVVANGNLNLAKQHITFLENIRDQLNKGNLELIAKLQGYEAFMKGEQVTDPLSRLCFFFAIQLFDRLTRKRKKWGDKWQDKEYLTQNDLIYHLQKQVNQGDPIDVAAYCAFAWHHQYKTGTPQPESKSSLIHIKSDQVKIESATVGELSNVIVSADGNVMMTVEGKGKLTIQGDVTVNSAEFILSSEQELGLAIEQGLTKSIGAFIFNEAWIDGNGNTISYLSIKADLMEALTPLLVHA